MQAGDKILFGSYEWRVLDIQNNTALIITEYIIDQRSYHDAYNDITWADCALRKYLNGEFYELTFYIGELGEAFDSNKVIRKSYIKIEKTVLNTIFEYLKYNDKVLAQKAEMQRKQRTTLTLG